MPVLESVDGPAKPATSSSWFWPSQSSPSSTADVMKRSAQLWCSITPILSVALTALTFLLTFFFQVHQESRSAQEKEDSEWRSTLQNVSLEEKSLVPGALEVQSFFSSPRYSHQARAIATLLLPKMADTATFDIIFFDMADRTTKDDEEDLLNIARATTADMRTLYDHAMMTAAKEKLPADTSFKNFLANPGLFLLDPGEAANLKVALADDWKLDSVSVGLHSLWRGGRHANGVTPAGHDLSGIVLVNNNYEDAGLTQAQLQDAEFAGTCRDSKGKKVECLGPKN